MKTKEQLEEYNHYLSYYKQLTIEVLKNRNTDIDVNNKNAKLWSKLRRENNNY